MVVVLLVGGGEGAFLILFCFQREVCLPRNELDL